MRAEFVNPFVVAAQEILEKEIQAKIEKKQPFLREKSFTASEVSIEIGMTGKVKGHVIFGMKLEVAMAVASTMIGDPVSEFDEMASSAIGELGNMISGLAAIYLEKAGFACDITPPSIMRGPEMVIHTTVQALVLPLGTQYGDIDIGIALEAA